MNETEWERFHNEKDPADATLYQLQMQLYSGWFDQRDDVLRFELGAAAVRVGAKINDTSVPKFLQKVVTNEVFIHS